MLSEWFERHHKAVGVLLLFLAGLNGWMAYAVFAQHHLLASANGALAVIIVLAVVRFRRAGEHK